ncbi:hypothetical protein LG634_14500 [Streptomyces bambusae]|uniref:hypothetical protein n=1 Tax=Streptomyces bambusae TaxID=1550616 RepID=UPI001CFE9391|nr:hypothetical protein [Streptomyces bambusae]MCB5166042.1 hypothetical protein [Streptomyces bambusae]
MGSQDQHRRPDMFGAIGAVLAEKQAAAEAARAPERQAFEAALDRDAALYGTAGWESLTPARKALVGRHVAAGTAAGTEAA